MGRYWHPRTWLRRLALSTGAVILMLGGFAAATRAANYVFSDITPVTLTGSGITLQILGGSRADSLDINATTLTVAVASGESFSLRYPGPNPGTLSNTGGTSGCNNNGFDNDVVVNGPATVTFTPDSATPCPAPAGGGGGGGGGGTSSPTILVVSPNGNETLDAGTATNLFWQSGGNGIIAVRLSLSTDSGVSWTVISASETNDGLFSWTVPDLATTHGRIKAEGLGTGNALLVQDMSDADFTVRALPATIVPAPTIDADKNLPLPPAPALCIAGTRIKLACAAGAGPNDPCRAVYYCGKDGKRYVFPDAQTYFSWYPDFIGIVIIAKDVMAQISIGGNITYKPGSLVKIQTDPKVYVVSRGGVLRWIPTETIAIALFGRDWADLVHDVPVVFFLNYVVGAPMQAP
jgi:hypothetical protein